MSINNIGGNTTPTDPRSGGAQSTGDKAGSAAGGHEAAPGNSADTVNISSSATDLQAMEARLAELPEVDSARVEELRNQIASGEYNIDSQRVAERILAFESEL